MTDEQVDQKIKGMTPYYRDFCEVWGNTWAPVRVRPGTCEACVYNRGPHSETCEHWIVVALRTSRPSPESVEMLREVNRQYDRFFRGLKE